MTNVTSIENYREARARGVTGRQHQRIVSLLELGGAWSRAEIADWLDLRLSSVCGRVNELQQAGRIETVDIRRCRITGKRVAVVRMVQ